MAAGGVTPPAPILTFEDSPRGLLSAFFCNNPFLLWLLLHPAQPLPKHGIDRQWIRPHVLEVDERAMDVQATVPQQLPEQIQSSIRHVTVGKQVLFGQRFRQ